MKRYMTKDQAFKATAKRSLFAHVNKEFSQYEVRRHGSSYVGGTPDVLEKLFPECEIVGQWSAGYWSATDTVTL